MDDLESTALLNRAADIAALAARLKTERILAVDTEFIRESTFFPTIEIIQIATRSQSWLVDARAFKKGYRADEPHSFDSGINPLLEILRDPDILKVFHAAQADQECLYTSFGTLARPILDTAVAASLCGLGENLGLAKLLSLILKIEIEKGHARTHWSARPLPLPLQKYAHADVEHLVALGEALLAQTQRLGRQDWALKLSAQWNDPKLYEPDLEQQAQRLARGQNRVRLILALLQWREQRVRLLNIPRRWFADDQVLVNLAHSRPKDLAHLATFRGLHRQEVQQRGLALLQIIAQAPEGPLAATTPTGRIGTHEERRGQKSSASVPSETKIVSERRRRGSPSPSLQDSELRAAEAIKCFLGTLAHRIRIAGRYLLSSEQIALLVRLSPATLKHPSVPQILEQLVADEMLGEESARLIGSELIAFLRGEWALRLREGELQVVPWNTRADPDSTLC